MVEQLELLEPREALLRIRWIAILRAQTRITLAAWAACTQPTTRSMLLPGNL